MSLARFGLGIVPGMMGDRAGFWICGLDHISIFFLTAPNPPLPCGEAPLLSLYDDASHRPSSIPPSDSLYSIRAAPRDTRMMSVRETARGNLAVARCKASDIWMCGGESIGVRMWGVLDDEGRKEERAEGMAMLAPPVPGLLGRRGGSCLEDEEDEAILGSICSDSNYGLGHNSPRERLCSRCPILSS